MSKTQIDSAKMPETVPLARELLELFSVERSLAALSVEDSAPDRRALWRADALHRANNLAQMASSLDSTRIQALFGPRAAGVGAGARALARVYAELGAHDATSQPIPCAPLLKAVATHLVSLFSGDRSITLRLVLDEIAMPAEQRRAIVLIASELVINALKYAFPPGGEGAISVELVRRCDTVQLSVADDGIGLGPEMASGGGSGSGLIERLSALLGGDLRRVSKSDGLTVTVSVSLASPASNGTTPVAKPF